ncbi:MAG: DUF3850 domain-containing protein, partial [Rhodobacteraceae bacterium]|nr:DUF3850 domain-containing protein [Paracoccaceae bacterium]
TGDELVLRRTDERGYSSPIAGDKLTSDLSFRITYLLQGGQFGIEPGFCVLGLGPVDGKNEAGE